MSFGCSYRKVVHNLSTDLFRFCYTSNVMHFFVCVPFPFKLLPKNKWHFLAASRFMMNVLFLFLLPENGIQIYQLNWVFCLQRDVHLLNLHKDLISSAFKLFSRFLYIWHCAERKKRQSAPSRWMVDAMNMITSEPLTAPLLVLMMKFSILILSLAFEDLELNCLSMTKLACIHCATSDHITAIIVSLDS